jgi:flagellar biosynthesis/type III secretory pathway M-ring protein FliF/YscJ
MPENPPRTGQRPWAMLVAAVVVLFLIVVALAMWSEREDARRLPPEELEPVEQVHPAEPPPRR